ncbi:MAG: hypothetical protein NTZ10_03440 [Candidatus Saganbacteria bacterium]|nr:hypothetical protein [Candidatus Saganbacteria bacterium]
MNINLVLIICLVAVTIGILVMIAYVIMLLSHVRRILKPVDKMLNDLSAEFRPLLNDMSGISGSVNSFLGRFDRITGLVFGKLDMMAQGMEKANTYVQRFVKNPKVEIESIGAGLKKAAQILFRKKGE